MGSGQLTSPTVYVKNFYYFSRLQFPVFRAGQLSTNTQVIIHFLKNQRPSKLVSGRSLFFVFRSVG